MKKVCILALYFAIILVIFMQFSSKNVEKQINLGTKIEASESAIQIEETEKNV